MINKADIFVAAVMGVVATTTTRRSLIIVLTVLVCVLTIGPLLAGGRADGVSRKIKFEVLAQKEVPLVWRSCSGGAVA